MPNRVSPGIVPQWAGLSAGQTPAQNSCIGAKGVVLVQTHNPNGVSWAFISGQPGNLNIPGTLGAALSYSLSLWA